MYRVEFKLRHPLGSETPFEEIMSESVEHVRVSGLTLTCLCGTWESACSAIAGMNRSGKVSSAQLTGQVSQREQFIAAGV